MRYVHHPTADVEAFYTHVSQQVKRLRTDAGLSQVGVATAAGVSQSTLCFLEHGPRECTLYTLYCIAEALDVDLTDLLPPRAEPRRRRVLVTVGGKHHLLHADQADDLRRQLQALEEERC